MLTMEFTNYSNKANNWNNWILAVTTDADRSEPAAAPRRADTEYKEYFVLRADSYCWGVYGNSNPDDPDGKYYAGYVLSNNYSWETFKNDMDGSNVKLAVKRDGAKIVAHADITTAGGTEYFENLEVDNCDDGEQPIRAFLTVEGACLDLKSAVVADNPSATGIETVKAAANTSVVRYNLAGQKVGEGYRGVVIENGQKFMVK